MLQVLCTGIWVLSIHRVLRRIPLARNHFDLHVLPLLIFYLELASIGSNDLHFQLAVGAVQFRVGRAIRYRISAADVFPNIAENFSKLRLESGEVRSPTG